MSKTVSACVDHDTALVASVRDVGLNPFGKKNTSAGDVVLVVAAFVVAAALVAWAFLA